MRTIFESKRLLLLERDGWEFVERKKGKSAVAIIALTDDDELILTEQARNAVNTRVIDLPAGLVGDEDGSENPDEAARKELLEETGFECEKVAHLTTCPTSPGITSEFVSLYRARGLRRVGQGGGVEGEKITVHLVPRSELFEWLGRQKAAIDNKVWAAMYFINKTS
jgi:ADP-ribose pyrophosphatase